MTLSKDELISAIVLLLIVLVVAFYISNTFYTPYGMILTNYQIRCHFGNQTACSDLNMTQVNVVGN